MDKNYWFGGVMSAVVFGDAIIDVIVPIYNIKPSETYYRNILVMCGGVANVAIQLTRLGESVYFIGKDRK